MTHHHDAAPVQTVVFVVAGPAQHSVVILAGQIATRMVGMSTPAHRPTVVVTARGDGLEGNAQLRQTLTSVSHPGPAASPPDAVVHVHFTDQLFGPDCAAAAASYERLAGSIRGDFGARLSVTLHDVPMDVDAPDRYQRRAAAYRRVVAATDGPVIVNSGHEAALIRAIAPEVDPVVIPLPVAAAPERPSHDAVQGDDDVAILGFLYPDKGHAEALDALEVLPRGVGLAALGRVADGHAELAEELTDRAAQLGRRFTVTGWIADAELMPRLRRARVPLAGHRQLSASGSIGSWLSAGRRPLVPDLAYTRELSARWPGTLCHYPPTGAGLRRALVRAYDDPDSTWLDPGVAIGPPLDQVAEAYRTAMHRRDRVGST